MIDPSDSATELARYLSARLDAAIAVDRECRDLVAHYGGHAGAALWAVVAESHDLPDRGLARAIVAQGARWRASTTLRSAASAHDPDPRIGAPTVDRAQARAVALAARALALADRTATADDPIRDGLDADRAAKGGHVRRPIVARRPTLQLWGHRPDGTYWSRGGVPHADPRNYSPTEVPGRSIALGRDALRHERSATASAAYARRKRR